MAGNPLDDVSKRMSQAPPQMPSQPAPQNAIDAVSHQRGIAQPSFIQQAAQTEINAARNGFNPVSMALSSPAVQNGLNKVSQVMDVPLAYVEAGVSDIFKPGEHGHWYDFSWNAPQNSSVAQVTRDLHSGGPANVSENDIYFRRGSLHRVLADPSATATQKAYANYFLKHPWVAGTLDFATEFLNPSNAVGGIVGRGARVLTKIPSVGRGLEELEASTRIGNRFAGMRLAGRDVGINPEHGEQIGRQFIDRRSQADLQAYEQAMGVLGGLTRDEQKAVIHRMQGSPVMSFGQEKDALLKQRADALRTLMWQITRDQLKAGTLDPAKIYGREQMFPGVFGEFNNDFEARALSHPEQEQVVERALSGQRPKVDLNTTNLTPDNAKLLQARNDVLNERADRLHNILQQDEPPQGVIHFFPMRGAFNDPKRDEELLEFLEHHTSSGIGGGVGIRRGTAGMNAPRRTHATLADAERGARGIDPNWVPADSLYRFLAQRNKNVLIEQAMNEALETGLVKDASERIPGDKFVPASDVNDVRTIGSPTLRDRAVHQHFVNFLNEVGASKGEADAFFTATSALGKAGRMLAPGGPGWRASQQLARMFVISNPIIHAGWNLMFQYLGAGGDIRDLVKLNEAFARDAEKYGAITHRGAPRTLTDGSDIGLASRPMSDLSMGEQIRRRAAQVQEANAKIVFDRAERRYAAALYQTYVKRGMNEYEAGNAVRRALGDYANVSNYGIDKAMQQTFFFYPWLKTILPFWIKHGVTTPQTWNPAHRLAQTHNELAGDPNADTGNEGPFTIYTGMVNGRPSYYSIPLPQRILGQVADVGVGALTGDQSELAKGAKGLFLNRVSPFAKVGLSALSGLTSKEPQPQGITGYAPFFEKVKSAVSTLGDYVPAPVQAMYHAARVLFGQEQIQPSVIAGELVGGTGYVGVTPQQQQISNHIRAAYYRAIDRALKNGNRASAWQFFQLMQKRLEQAGLGQEPSKPNPATETNPLPVEVPQGSVEQTTFSGQP